MNAVIAGTPSIAERVGWGESESREAGLPDSRFFGNLFVRVSAAKAGIRARKGRHTERG
jgi:hypothetical protein